MTEPLSSLYLLVSVITRSRGDDCGPTSNRPSTHSRLPQTVDLGTHPEAVGRKTYLPGRRPVSTNSLVCGLMEALDSPSHGSPGAGSADISTLGGLAACVGSAGSKTIRPRAVDKGCKSTAPTTTSSDPTLTRVATHSSGT